MGHLFAVDSEFRLPAKDVKQLLRDADAQQRWLGASSSLPQQPDRVGALQVGGWGRAVQRLDDGTFRLETGSVVTILELSVTSADTKSRRCMVEIRERLVSGDPDPHHVAGWQAWWDDALARLGDIVEVIRRRRTPTQAVVIIHGIGEQRPGDTLRSFVEAATLPRPPKKEADATSDKDRDPKRTRPPLYSKPDHMSDSYELRRMSMAAFEGTPKTDFFELYWAHHIRDTTTPQVTLWLAKLLARPKRMRPALRRLWATILVVAAIAGGVGFYLSGVLAGLPATVRGLLATVVIPSILAAVSWVIIRVLGDAPRYLSPAAANVDVRDRIRSQGVSLLLDLHRSKRYDRIVVVGHSLGSVIAYDMVSILWGMLHLDHDNPVSPPRKHAAAVNGAAGKEPVEAHPLQYAAWEEMRRATQPWLITDLVTVGSPLAHAELLIGKPGREVRDLAKDRQLPTSPPVQDERGDSTFYRDIEYVDRDGGKGNFVYFHNAAPFAVTRWTNIYVPIRKIALGDPVGGPLSPLFGKWVWDRKVTSPHKLAHTKYWICDESDVPDTVVALQDALRLNSRRVLENLLSSLPAYTQMDQRASGTMRGGLDL